MCFFFVGIWWRVRAHGSHIITVAKPEFSEVRYISCECFPLWLNERYNYIGPSCWKFAWCDRFRRHRGLRFANTENDFFRARCVDCGRDIIILIRTSKIERNNTDGNVLDFNWLHIHVNGIDSVDRRPAHVPFTSNLIIFGGTLSSSKLPTNRQNRSLFRTVIEFHVAKVDSCHIVQSAAAQTVKCEAFSFKYSRRVATNANRKRFSFQTIEFQSINSKPGISS